MITFNEIYKRHYRATFKAINKIVRNQMDAEELTNEAMIRVHKNLKTYNEDMSKLSTWIYNIGKNAAIDFMRKKRVHVTSLDSVMFDNESDNDTTDHLIELKSTENNPEEVMVEDEVKRTMYEHFNQLNESDKIVATLHYFDGLSYDEIAVELSLPLGTVKAKIHRARVKLMDAFPVEMRKVGLIER